MKDFFDSVLQINYFTSFETPLVHYMYALEPIINFFFINTLKPF